TIEEGGVVAAAGVRAEEADGEPGPRVLGGGEACVRRTAEDARADERALCTDRNAGDVGILRGNALVSGDGVRGEGLNDGCGQERIAAAHENVCGGLPLQFDLCSLRAVCERVDVGREDRRQRADACAGWGAGRADAEVLRQRLAADAFELVVEDVVEVAAAQDKLLAEDV